MKSYLSICALAFSSFAFGQQDTSFQITYATNLNTEDATFSFSNSGAISTTAIPQNGSLCLNVYTFGANSAMVGCCACALKPDGYQSLSAKTDLTPRGFTGNSIVVKAISSTAGAGACNPTTVGTPGNTAATGMLAWITSIEGVSGVVAPSRIAFTPATLSTAELTSLNTVCTALSGAICQACR